MIIKHQLPTDENGGGEDVASPTGPMPVTNFNPVQTYLAELRRGYSNFALFFYDDYGGKVVNVLIKPDLFQSRPFKYSNVEGCCLDGSGASMEKDNVVVNLAAMVEDWTIMGDGLVEEVLMLIDRQ